MPNSHQPKTTSHWASSEEDCEEMAKKYSWKLKEINRDSTDPLLPVECIYEGDAAFPKSRIDYSAGVNNDN